MSSYFEILAKESGVQWDESAALPSVSESLKSSDEQGQEGIEGNGMEETLLEEVIEEPPASKNQKPTIKADQSPPESFTSSPLQESTEKNQPEPGIQFSSVLESAEIKKLAEEVEHHQLADEAIDSQIVSQTPGDVANAENSPVEEKVDFENGESSERRAGLISREETSEKIHPEEQGLRAAMDVTFGEQIEADVSESTPLEKPINPSAKETRSNSQLVENGGDQGLDNELSTEEQEEAWKAVVDWVSQSPGSDVDLLELAKKPSSVEDFLSKDPKDNRDKKQVMSLQTEPKVEQKAHGEAQQKNKDESAWQGNPYATVPAVESKDGMISIPQRQNEHQSFTQSSTEVQVSVGAIHIKVEEPSPQNFNMAKKEMMQPRAKGSQSKQGVSRRLSRHYL
ncbi:MAG: hypothetical protein AAGA18_13870 [Verrucomicrobiota bacterium]